MLKPIACTQCGTPVIPKPGYAYTWGRLRLKAGPVMPALITECPCGWDSAGAEIGGLYYEDPELLALPSVTQEAAEALRQCYKDGHNRRVHGDPGE